MAVKPTLDPMQRCRLVPNDLGSDYYYFFFLPSVDQIDPRYFVRERT